MSNLPGYDLADHISRTMSAAWTAQIRVYNDAWKKIEAGNYDVKNLIADYAKIYRNHYEAYRGVATFGTRSVEWQQKTVGKGAVEYASFQVPSGIPLEHVEVSRADRTGGPAPKGKQVTVSDASDDDGIFTVKIKADKNVASGDQWIAFVFDKVGGGSPLGALLIHIGP